jgi:putative transcriptional regulator
VSLAVGDEIEHRVEVHLDRLLEDRGMTLTELADRVGVTVVNLSILKNGRAKAVRFSTLTRLCEVLGCRPGDLLTVGDQNSANTEQVSLEELVGECAGRVIVTYEIVEVRQPPI